MQADRTSEPAEPTEDAESARLVKPPDSEPAQQEEAPRRAGVVQYVRILLACGFYLAIGPSLILINRTILKERGFNYPMMLSGLGLLFSTAVSSTLVCCSCLKLEHRELVTLSFFMRNLVPVGAAMAATLAAGNAVYLFLPVGFIQVRERAMEAVGVRAHALPSTHDASPRPYSADAQSVHADGHADHAVGDGHRGPLSTSPDGGVWHLRRHGDGVARRGLLPRTRPQPVRERSLGPARACWRCLADAAASAVALAACSSRRWRRRRASSSRSASCRISNSGCAFLRGAHSHAPSHPHACRVAWRQARARSHRVLAPATLVPRAPRWLQWSLTGAAQQPRVSMSRPH